MSNYELKRRIDIEIAKTGEGIVTGHCEADTHHKTLRNYYKQTGYIEGLMRAVQISEDIEAGREA